MSDDQEFPALKTFKELEKLLYSQARTVTRGLKGFLDSINCALDQIGFTDTYVREQVKTLSKEKLTDAQVEENATAVSKVIKDVIWGMIELDATSIAILDTPILQRLRHIRQNGFTYLVYPPASHARFEHSLGVFAVAAKYIESINASTKNTNRLAYGLSPEPITPKLALDIKHAAMLHDTGHLPFSHVLEAIFESAPEQYTVGSTLVRDFEICFMNKLRNTKSHLSEKLSIALILSPRFKKYYSALRRDPWAYLRVACLVSGTSLDDNIPGYSQLISGAVDCDKVDYLLRDSLMCNVPVAIDKARLFLNSALIKCSRESTIKKLIERGVLNLASADLEKPALILVLNSSGVDTIEEVAFARATLYERVYRHSVTRNAERMLSIAHHSLQEADKRWRNVLSAFAHTDDTFISSLSGSKSTCSAQLAARLRRRDMPKRALAFSPDIYAPVVPYVTIFSGASDGESASQHYHEFISKDPFHEIVEGLKERSTTFSSNKRHLELEERIAVRSEEIVARLRRAGASGVPNGLVSRIFFIPLPDHSTNQTSCALITREGELESSNDYSRAPQLVSAKEIGRSFGFVSCDPQWAEVVFLAAQEILYDYFGDDIVRMDMPLDFREANTSHDGQTTTFGVNLPSRPRSINVGAIKRFYLPEHLASRRCRLERRRLANYRDVLSAAGHYDRRPRLATPVPRKSDVIKIAATFKDYSGQHGWTVTEESLRQFLNQFPPSLRSDAKTLIWSLNFLNRTRTAELLRTALTKARDKLSRGNHRGAIYLVPLAGTSAHVSFELLKQEFRNELKKPPIRLSFSVHEMLGTAKVGDAVVFVDDNIGSGTQFSAQLLQWCGLLRRSVNRDLQEEKGIEFAEFDPNRRARFENLEIELATCVGGPNSEVRVRENLEGSKLNFGGLFFGDTLSGGTYGGLTQDWTPPAPLIEFLRNVGSECVRHCRRLPTLTDECFADALGYGNMKGLTVSLWNVPTSTYTALWSPGVVDGEPWCPLFIRRGYVANLVIA